MTEPLRLDFAVDCTPQHAFTTWTADLGRWWPRDHTMTGAPAAIVLEPREGGRIFERAADGTEHDWGTVRSWDPPGLLVYSWHLGRDQSYATEVEIRFTAAGSGTLVEVEHRGWDSVTAGDGWRDRTVGNWHVLYPHFVDYAQGGPH